MPDPFDAYYVWLGIPPEEQPPNFYRLLGLRPLEQNADVISNALDQRRTYLRSVQSGQRAAYSQRLLNEVSVAGVTLLDPAKKIKYDEELRKRLAANTEPAGEIEAPASPMKWFAVSALTALLTVLIAGGGWRLLMAKKPSAQAESGKSAKLVSPVSPTIDATLEKATAPGESVPAVVETTAKTLADPESAVGTISPTTPAIEPRTPGPRELPSTSTDSKTSSSKTVGQNPQSSVAPGFAGPMPSGVAGRLPPGFPRDAPPGFTVAPSAGATRDSFGQPESQQIGKAEPVRRPQPSAAESASAIDEARKVYEAAAKAATKSTQKAALAGRILQDARSTQNNFTTRYVLFELARKFYVQAGEVREAISAAETLQDEYEVPADQVTSLTVDALDDVPQLPSEQRTELARAAAQLCEKAIAAEDFERADKLSTIALQSANKQKDNDLKKEITQRRAQVMAIVKQWRNIKANLEKLKTEPEDVASNLLAGRFFCFTLENFDRGLEYLAASGDPLLAPVAERDLAGPSGGPQKTFAAASAWQEAQTSLTDKDERLAAQRREKWLLTQALSGLEGFDAAKATKRLEDLKDLAPSRTAIDARLSAKSYIAMIGRVTANRDDINIVVSYENGYAITKEDMTRFHKLCNMGISPLIVEFVGSFELPSEQTVVALMMGNSNASGTYTLYVDGRNHGSVGPGKRSVSTSNIRLQPGNHIVGWTWIGTGFDAAQLEFRVRPQSGDGQGQLVPLEINHEMETRARRPPVRGTMHFGGSKK
jgi:hypothetical protein